MLQSTECLRRMSVLNYHDNQEEFNEYYKTAEQIGVIVNDDRFSVHLFIEKARHLFVTLPKKNEMDCGLLLYDKSWSLFPLTVFDAELEGSII